MVTRNVIFLCWSLLLLQLTRLECQAQSAAPTKVALVIGVRDYQYVKPLRNSVNDAHALTATLRRKGFTVKEVIDPKTKYELQESVSVFTEWLRSNPNTTGFFFYAGHGQQVEGENYLIPTYANFRNKSELKEQCMQLSQVMNYAEEAGNELNIFVIDACRNNSFPDFSRSLSSGLNQVVGPKGSYVVFSTRPNAVADDGEGKNSLFASKLLKHMDEEGLSLEQVFKRTAGDVIAESNDKQRPWLNFDYPGDFYFTPGTAAPVPSITASSATTKAAGSDIPPAAILDYGYGPDRAPVLEVGNQQWFSRNLNVSWYANGDSILEARTEAQWVAAVRAQKPAWCYYDNSPKNGGQHGKLYNWYAVTDPRGLCPKGWHVPTDAEWVALAEHLGGEANAGGKLKASTGWPNGGNNSVGFNGLPSGERNTFGNFLSMGSGATWWSSTEANDDQAFNRNLDHVNSKFPRYPFQKGEGLSVRCKKN